jgi:hypothetical protein
MVGLAKPFDAKRALKAEGFTDRDLRRMRLLASLTEAEMKQASAKTCAEVVDAADRAAEREARRIIRTRREAERLRLTDYERAILRIMERDLRRTLTEQEEHLALEQARSLPAWSERQRHRPVTDQRHFLVSCSVQANHLPSRQSAKPSGCA